jgi:hypothetical protein
MEDFARSPAVCFDLNQSREAPHRSRFTPSLDCVSTSARASLVSFQLSTVISPAAMASIAQRAAAVR